MNYLQSEDFQKVAKEGTVEEDAALCKNFTCDEVKAAKDQDNVIEFVISTGAVDRHGDTVDPAGWQTDNYMKNPVVLFGHDYRSPPIGRAISMKTLKTKGQLVSQAEFMSKDLYPFANTIYQMIKAGFLKSVSVGFRPINYSFSEDDDRKYGIDFKEQELLEYSVVPVPANPEALQRAYSQGIDVKPLREWAAKVLDNWEETETGIMVPRDKVEEMYKEITHKVKLTRKFLKDIEDAGVAKDEKTTVALDSMKTETDKENAKAEEEIQPKSWEEVVELAADFPVNGMSVVENVEQVQKRIEMHYKEHNQTPPWQKDAAKWDEYVQACEVKDLDGARLLCAELFGAKVAKDVFAETQWGEQPANPEQKEEGVTVPTEELELKINVNAEALAGLQEQMKEFSEQFKELSEKLDAKEEKAAESTAGADPEGEAADKLKAEKEAEAKAKAEAEAAQKAKGEIDATPEEVAAMVSEATKQSVRELLGHIS